VGFIVALLPCCLALLRSFVVAWQHLICAAEPEQQQQEEESLCWTTRLYFRHPQLALLLLLPCRIL